jgi:HSP20 family protein
MMTTLQNRVSALFADPLQTVLEELKPEFHSNRAAAPTKLTPMSVWEDEGTVFVEMDLPGVSLEDIEVAVHKGQLTIRGRRKMPAARAAFVYQERFFGEFQRSVLLDDSIDPASIEAHLHDGVLRVRLAKKPEAQRQRITVNYGQAGDTKRLESNSA